MIDLFQADLSRSCTVRRVCDKPVCKHPARAAKHPYYHNAQYCCLKLYDLSISKACLDRTKTMNKLFILELEWLQIRRTCNAMKVLHGSLLLNHQDTREAPNEQMCIAATISQELEEAGHSYNGCMHLKVVLVGVLAFFAEYTYSAFVQPMCAEYLQDPLNLKQQVSPTSRPAPRQPSLGSISETNLSSHTSANVTAYLTVPLSSAPDS